MSTFADENGPKAICPACGWKMIGGQEVHPKYEAVAQLIEAARRFVRSREMAGWKEGECDLFLGPIWHAAQDALRAAGEEL